DAPASPLTPEQRLLVLDAWRRSGLPAGDFAPRLGVSKPTRYAWKRKWEADGPAGLGDGPRGRAGRRLPEATRRALLLLTEANGVRPPRGEAGLQQARPEHAPGGAVVTQDAAHFAEDVDEGCDVKIGGGFLTQLPGVAVVTQAPVRRRSKDVVDAAL